MSAAHTPGPWRVDPDDRPGMEWNNHIYAANDMCVCFMAHDGDGINKKGEANARLIAAAPLMLEELQAAHFTLADLLALTSNIHARERIQLSMANIHAAITKATGA